MPLTQVELKVFCKSWLIIDKYCIEPDFVKSERFKQIQINDFFKIFIDKEESIYISHNGNHKIAFIGYAVDIENIHLDCSKISNNLINCYRSDMEIINNIKLLNMMYSLCGRYCIFIFDKDKCYAFNDACGLKSVYYHCQYKVLASHAELLNEVTKESKSFLDYSDIVKKYKEIGAQVPWCLPGDLTLFNNIYILIPNHFIEISSHKIIRFYPCITINGTIFNNIYNTSNYIARKLKSILKRVSQDFKLFVSLTAGFDSRITLSCCKPIRNEICCFTYQLDPKNNEEYHCIDANKNVDFARYLSFKLGLKYVEFDLSKYKFIQKDIDILRKNHYHISNHRILYAIEDEINKLNCKNIIHIRSNVYEIIRRSYFDIKNNIETKEVASLLTRWSMYRPQTPYYEIVRKYYEEYIKKYDIEKIINNDNFNYGDLFYIEYRMAQWQSACLIEGDQLYDTFIPINCVKLIDCALSISKEYKDRNILAKLIIEKNWPELLQDFNYPNTFVSSYKLIDFNSNLIPGSVKPYDDFYEKYPYSVESGNVSCKTLFENYIIETTYDSIIWGFSNNRIEKGDYIQVSFNFDTLKNRKYYLSFDISCFWKYYDKDYNSYEIIINDKKKYEKNINSFSRPNKIVYSFTATDDSILLKIRTKCNRSPLSNKFNSIIKINNFVFRQDTIKNSDKEIFFTTDEIFHFLL